MNEYELLDNKQMREELSGRIEVLDKVGKLVLLPNDFGATTEMVANYFEVGSISAIKSLVKDNRKELEENGYKVVSTKDFDSSFKELANISPKSRTVALFTKRTILNIAMLLRDSEVAKEIRKQLLNVMENKQAQDEFKFNVNTEKELMLEVMMADTEEQRMIAMSKYREFKNRYINKLEEKADYHDKVLKSEGLIAISKIANDLSMSAIKLNKILHENGVIYKQGKTWLLYEKYYHLIDDKICDYEVNEHGQLLKWTEKGRKWIIEFLDKISK